MHLPDGWRALQLRDFCEFVQGGRKGLTKQEHYRNSGVPAFSAAGQDGFVDVAEFQNTHAVILSAIGANCGRCFLADGDWTTLANVQAVIPKIEQASARFLHYRVNRDDYWPRSGSAQPFIKPSDMKSCWLALPPLHEQEAISGILDALDTAIAQTEAIIAKLKAVKQGLLHDLLTRGIDANGQLRPPQSEAPQLYKPSELGWIPNEWDSKQLAELLGDFDPAMRSGPFGSALMKQELVEAGFPLLGIDNVHTEQFVGDYSRFVTPRKFAQLARYAVRPGDLMITIMGTVGRCCLVPENIGHALSSKHTWTISLDQDAYSPYLAMLQVNYSPWVLGHFVQDQQGGTMAAIRSETLKSTRLPVPPRDEQRLIEERLRELGNRIDLEVDSLAKHHFEKTGLIDDLLTGRVRVTPLLEAAAA